MGYNPRTGEHTPPPKPIIISPGNAPISKGRRLLTHEGGTDMSAIAPTKRYERKVQQENEEIPRRECINAFIAAEDPAGLKAFLEKLHAVYKKQFIKNTFEYAKKQVADSRFPEHAKEEIFELIKKEIKETKK